MRNGSLPAGMTGIGELGSIPKPKQPGQNFKKKSRSGNPAKRAAQEGN
jgi:hypothetical protein